MARVYQSDPDPAPDGDFTAGEPAHLVAGNRGRLLDARRTPVVVTGVKLETAVFEVEIRAFEDAGARWELPVEDVGGFQFARDSPRAAPEVVAALLRAAARFDRPGDVACDPAARAATRRRLAAEREWARGRLSARRGALRAVDVPRAIASREGDPALFSLLDEVLGDRGLAEIERRFTATFVSNPRSGEVVKGHAIVLAELGLCPYRGKVARDPDLFAGSWAKDRRAEHLLARMALTQELWSVLGAAEPPLYRAAATEAPLPARRPASFVSATFSGEVAAAHFEGGPYAALWRQPLPHDRLLMTFLETEAMNHPYNEAEAVLIGDPDNRAF